MKKNVVKFLILILLFGGLFMVTGCNDGANQFDDPEEPTVNPGDPENPEDPEDPEDPEYYSKGFTIYELMDSAGNLIDAYAVGNYEGKDTEVIIPSTWKEKPVIKILDNTFEGNDKITKVTIPASVQVIGKKAFAECTKLKTVVVNEGSELKEIGEEAFLLCSSMKNFAIPEGVIKIGASSPKNSRVAFNTDSLFLSSTTEYIVGPKELIPTAYAPISVNLAINCLMLSD